MTGELTRPANLCTPAGRLHRDAVGWTRRPLHTCNLRGSKLRTKRWNNWIVQGERQFFAVGIADFGYSAAAYVCLVDLVRKRVVQKNVGRLFGRGATLGETPYDASEFQTRGFTFTETHERDATSVMVTCDRFDDNQRLSAALRFVYPDDFETLGIVAAWSDERFHYASKHVGVPVAARVRIGQREIPFDGVNAFAYHDFGRGVWPRRAGWTSAATAGYVGDDYFGLNLGGGWTDGSAVNENALFLNGTLHKIEGDLEWTYNEVDHLQPWRIRSRDGDAVDLTFEPVAERKHFSDSLLVRRRNYQVYGLYSGHVTADDRRIEVPDLLGWAEEHRMVW